MDSALVDDSFMKMVDRVMRVLWIGGILLLEAAGSLAQSGLANRLSGAEGLYETNPGVWGLVAYTASLASQRETIAGVYGEKRFMTDLNFSQLAYCGEVLKEHFLVSFSREGTNALSLNSINLAFAKRINAVLQIGLSIGYRSYSAKGYPGRGMVSAGIGAVLHLNEHICLGLQLDQLNELISKKTEFPFIFRVGMGYRLSSICALSIEITKAGGPELQADAGIKYSFHGNVYARMGYSPGLSLFSFSAGYQKDKFQAELGPAYHLSLGATWGLNMMYRFNKIE